MSNGPICLGALTILLVASMAPAMQAALQPKHPELVNVQQEAHAECIAIMLDGKPKKQWRALAMEYAADPKLCMKVMQLPNKVWLPMKGGDWRDRLDVGRSAIDP